MKDSLAALPWCLAYGRLLHSLSLWSWRWSATGLEELKFAFKTRSDSTSERQPITKALQFQILLVASVFRFYAGRSGTDRSDRPAFGDRGVVKMPELVLKTVWKSETGLHKVVMTFHTICTRLHLLQESFRPDIDWGEKLLVEKLAKDLLVGFVGLRFVVFCWGFSIVLKNSGC